MPRGVYDRTKTKEQRSAEKNHGAHGHGKKSAKTATAAAPQKRKYTRRATANVNTGAEPKAYAKHISTPDDSFALMTEVRQNLAVLSQLGDKFSDIPALHTEIASHVDLLGKLREKAFTTDDNSSGVGEVSYSANETEEEDHQEAAPVAAAPVANGAGSYQGNVPLPPPSAVTSNLPPPSIPAH